MERVTTILSFWFGEAGDPCDVSARQAHLWWDRSQEMDTLIRHRFARTLVDAEQGILDDWLLTPSGRLALILVVDQFPRYIFRDSARSYAFDMLAWRWCVEGLEAGADRELDVLQRVFFYLPLLHSEAIDDQACAVSLLHRLAYEVPLRIRHVVQPFLDLAQRRREIVERFGRLPHRNALLGRATTDDERVFLAQGTGE